MTTGFKISKPGYNALTETDPNNLVISSDFGTLKYHISGTVQLAVSGSSIETSVTHGLGYIPFFVTYYKNPALTTRFSQTPEVFESLPSNYSYIESYADSTKVYFTVHTNTLNATVTFHYKIYRNNLGL